MATTKTAERVIWVFEILIEIVFGNIPIKVGILFLFESNSAEVFCAVCSLGVSTLVCKLHYEGDIFYTNSTKLQCPGDQLRPLPCHFVKLGIFRSRCASDFRFYTFTDTRAHMR